MQERQNTQSHLPSTKSSSVTSEPFALTGSSNTIGVPSIVVGGPSSPYLGLPIPHVAITTRIDPSLLTGYILPQFGNQLATMLAKVLDELEKNNREAIGPIVSILEPYMEVNRDLKVNVLPKSSREVNIEITKVGRVTPKIYLDESLT